MIRRGNVDPPLLDRLFVDGMGGGEIAAPLEDRGQYARPACGDMEDYEHRCHKVRGQLRDHLAQGLDPAGRRSNDHDVVAVYPSLSWHGLPPPSGHSRG